MNGCGGEREGLKRCLSSAEERNTGMHSVCRVVEHREALRQARAEPCPCLTAVVGATGRGRVRQQVDGRRGGAEQA